MYPRAHKALQPGRTVLLISAISYLVAFYFWPIANLTTAGANLHTYSEIITGSYYHDVLLKTFAFAAEVTLGCLLLAYPVAYFARIASPTVRRVILVASTIPLWTSLLGRTFGWVAILQRQGLINDTLMRVGLIHEPLELVHNTFGALVGSVYLMLPFMILSLYGPMSAVDINLVRAARTMGARPSQAFVSVFLPLSLPGIISGGLLVFILSLGFFVTPALLGGPRDQTWPMLIQQQLNLFANVGTAAALSFVLLIVTVMFLVTFEAVVGFDQFLGATPRLRLNSLFHHTRNVNITSMVLRKIGPLVRPMEARVTWQIFVGAVLLFLVLPYVVLVPMSLTASSYMQFPPTALSDRWYRALIIQGKWSHGAMTSVEVGIGAAALALVFGSLGAIGLSRSQSRTHRVVLAALLAPAMIPTMIYSVGAYYAAAAIGVVDTRLALALTQSTLGVPFVVILVATALSGIDPAIGYAARSSGAGAIRAFFRVTLPLIAPTFLIAAVVAFQQSFDELVVALFLTGVHTRTLPVVLWDSIINLYDPSVPAATVAAFVCILSLVVIAYAVSWPARRVRWNSLEISGG